MGLLTFLHTIVQPFLFWQHFLFSKLIKQSWHLQIIEICSYNNFFLSKAFINFAIFLRSSHTLSKCSRLSLMQFSSFCFLTFLLIFTLMKSSIVYYFIPKQISHESRRMGNKMKRKNKDRSQRIIFVFVVCTATKYFLSKNCLLYFNRHFGHGLLCWQYLFCKWRTKLLRTKVNYFLQNLCSLFFNVFGFVSSSVHYFFKWIPRLF